MSMPRILAVLSLAVLAACTGPNAQQEMAAAQTALLGEAMAYQRCLAEGQSARSASMESNHYLPERCQAERETYEAERAAFEATYGTAGDEGH
jgi:hypothetical protein